MRNQPQTEFVRRVKDGSGEAELVHLPDSEHEVFSMPNKVYEPYLERILAFYAEKMIAEE